LDYNTSNALIGLGTIGIVLFLYILAVIIIAFFKMFLVVTKKKLGGKKTYKFLYRKLFFNFIIEVSLEAYMELYIYGYISISSQFSFLSGDMIGIIIGFFSLLLSIVFLPFSLLKIIFFTNKQTLHFERNIETWGSLYEGIKYKTKYELSYNLVYIIRRLIYTSLGMYIKDYREGSRQIIGLLIVNLVMSMITCS
jgi:hypothetical protein